MLQVQWHSGTDIYLILNYIEFGEYIINAFSAQPGWDGKKWIYLVIIL
jgi:hypothetical protein